MNAPVYTDPYEATWRAPNPNMPWLIECYEPGSGNTIFDRASTMEQAFINARNRYKWKHCVITLRHDSTLT